MVLCSDSKFWQRETKIKAFFTASSSGPLPAVRQSFQQECRIRQVRPAILAVAGAAVVDLGLVVPFGFVPLLAFDKSIGVLDDLVICPSLIPASAKQTTVRQVS